MKTILSGLLLMVFSVGSAQSYDQQLNQAGAALQKKDYCTALALFKTAFKDSTKIGPYDLAYAALSAANCNEEALALNWLRKGQQKGLGKSEEEIHYISIDSGFMKLHNKEDWTGLISSMRKELAGRELLQQKESESWVKSIITNQVAPAKNGKYHKANPGFALYYSQADSLAVPYLVYVPKTYQPDRKVKAIVYLHGGVVNEENFNFKDPGLAKGEPVFSAADLVNAIVIYPFAKKSFGWVQQAAAFEHVLVVLKKVMSIYHLDESKIILGGMSNGGSATFWFAAQPQKVFKGFFALSALPQLSIGPINFANITSDKPLYSVNSKDDEVFPFAEVNKLYTANKEVATGWHFNTLQKGGHGFLYQPEGKEALTNIVRTLFNDD